MFRNLVDIGIMEKKMETTAMGSGFRAPPETKQARSHVDRGHLAPPNSENSGELKFGSLTASQIFNSKPP